MNDEIRRFVRLITDTKTDINTREEMRAAIEARFRLVKDGRALYHTDSFAFVISYSKNKSFSNVVLSLSKLEKYDHIPCFVVHVRKDHDNLIYLINSTFLNKISHSSKDLRVDNIRGSLLGSNIRKEIPEMNCLNAPEHFEELLPYHFGFTWQENLERLVEATHQIKPRLTKTILTDAETEILLQSPSRAKRFVESPSFEELSADLNCRCEAARCAIAVASHIDNVNIRGRIIEALITSDEDKRDEILHNIADIEHALPDYDTKNGLGDYVRSFDDADTYTDVKTKVLYLDSNPKAYNIDKFLKCMAEEKSVFLFFFVGIDEKGHTKTALCSGYHKELVATTILQHHWAGRGTRGCAQFSGAAINRILTTPEFRNEIDESSCKRFIQKLLDR